MPVAVGQNEKDLVRILDLAADMATPIHLATTQQLPNPMGFGPFAAPS